MRSDFYIEINILVSNEQIEKYCKCKIRKGTFTLESARWSAFEDGFDKCLNRLGTSERD